MRGAPAGRARAGLLGLLRGERRALATNGLQRTNEHAQHANVQQRDDNADAIRTIDADA